MTIDLDPRQRAEQFPKASGAEKSVLSPLPETSFLEKLRILTRYGLSYFATGDQLANDGVEAVYIENAQRHNTFPTSRLETIATDAETNSVRLFWRDGELTRTSTYNLFGITDLTPIKKPPLA